jgi:hypothetical protein
LTPDPILDHEHNDMMGVHLAGETVQIRSARSVHGLGGEDRQDGGGEVGHQ